MKKIKSVLLQGATQYSNFGDVLYADLFYKKCKDVGIEQVDFWQWKNYGISSFLRDKLDYHNTLSLCACLKADALILFSGGYLWDNKKKVKDRFFRFVFPALLFQLLRKPVYILGAGGGYVDTKWLRKCMVHIINGSEIITVRDQETKAAFNSYHVKKQITVTADTALMITSEMLPAFDERKKLNHFSSGKKKFVLHIPHFENGNAILYETIFPGVVRFLEAHREYAMIFCTDNAGQSSFYNKGYVLQMKDILLQKGIEFFDYYFYDAWQMCSFLNEADMIVTMKLHVGVLGASFGKSVISIPLHRDKVHNFYRAIGEIDRCIHINELSSNLVYQKLCKYHDKPICISDDMRKLAKENLAILERM